MKRITAHYPLPRIFKVQFIAVVAAGLLVLMLVAQLYAYENFASVLGVVLPYNDGTLITVSAALVVMAELFALPWLIGMKLSRLFRATSAFVAAAIGAFWLLIVLTNAHAANSALFGDKVVITGGIPAFILALVLVSSIAYVLYYDTRPRNP